MFQLFGPAHLATLVVLAGLSLAAVRWGRSAAPSQRAWARGALITILIAYIAASYLRLALAHRLRWSESLPLHLCDLTLAACILALWTRSQLAFELCYFWGLAGAVPALLMPDLREGFPSAAFLLFFLGHGLIVLVNVWLITTERLYPNRGSVRRAFLALNAYVLLVGMLDAVFDWNYGYLCRRPSQPSLLDYLGPWPWYIAGAVAIAVVSFFILYYPWRVELHRSSR